jgi:uncharacterized SAM-binding protein YcdF (DUF218 family)
MKKSTRIKLLILSLFFISLLLLKNSILIAAAEFLVDTDEFRPTPYVCILSGDAKNRATKAVELYNDGAVKQILCAGQNLHFISELLDSEIVEPEFTRAVLQYHGVPDSVITVIKYGTSTKQEVEAIINYCHGHQIKELMVITSSFHARRVRYSFDVLFEGANIDIILQGADHPRYNTTNWWKSESGLIACNNEWIKCLYYIYKY